jgi:TonB-linked SusC/RagA family outer membrane protein
MENYLNFFRALLRKWIKILQIMKLIFIFLLIGMLQVSANVYSQNEKINVEAEEVELSELLWQLQEESGIVFVYKTKDLQGVDKVTVNKKGATLVEILDEVLENTKLEYSLKDDVVVIKKMKTNKSAQKQKQNYKITGKITDNKGESLPGVSIRIKGSYTGTSTGIDGLFRINASKGQLLVFSMVGMETQEVLISDNTVLSIKMKEKVSTLDDVVVTGFVERDKNSFSGAVKTIKSEELLQVSSTSILKSLSIVDPSIVIVENNSQGSNPNYIPEIIIRGTSSLNARNEVGVNSPLIVIDGIESSISDLYDMDIFDIESVTVLKDASATALYGERAANGVILVTRKRDSQKNVRVNYNFSGRVDFADLSDYSLMNAVQKIELEKISGLYESSTGALDEEYNNKLARVNSGVNTDWIAKPLRTSFSQNHSISVSGRASGMSYRVSARYGDTKGVMKDDNRENLGLSAYLSYNYKGKFIASFRGSFSRNNNHDSKYGKFNDYVKINPYDAPYDENGELIKLLSYDIHNPLYEASLASFNKSKSKSFSSSLNLRWNIMPGLFVKSSGYIEGKDFRKDQFISPNSQVFKKVSDPDSKGSYEVDAFDRYNYYLKASVNFNKNLDDQGSMVTFNAGVDIRENSDDPYSFKAKGYYNDNLIAPRFGKFLEGSSPGGRSSVNTAVGGFLATNIIYRSRYFVDGSYRVSGSSKFGKENRFAPFWSIGAGWNVHKENFLNYNWIDIVRLRANYGHTGSVNFRSYQAITTYKYDTQYDYKYGLGANPITMGNKDLKWQTTQEYNLGLNSTLLNNRLSFNFDIYKKKTVDMIVPTTLPLSVGVQSVQVNIGEQKNEGFETMLSGMIIKKPDLNWRVSLGVSSNKTTLVDIGDALGESNKEKAKSNSPSPISLLIEGESPTMIYAVRSAGIDPANGREIFIKKDGTYTYIYDTDDKVAIGDKTPDFIGSGSSYFTWKGLTLGVNLRYSYGGYIYNETRASRIEKIDARYNSDSRAFTNRWKKPGDVVEYLNLTKPYELDLNIHTSRFVEKENYITVSSINMNYEFTSKLTQKIGFKRLRIGLDVNEPFKISTVKQERGLYYPYSRGFTFTLSATF